MRRRALSVAVGASCVIAASIVVLLTGGFVGGADRAKKDSVAPFVLIDGRPVPYDDPQRWADASIVSRDARELTIFATGSTDSGGGSCGPPALRFRVQETGRTVSVLVAGYEAPIGVSTACPAIGYSPSPHTLRLEYALGTRVVLDASTRRHVALLVGTEHPTLPSPPAGLIAAPLRQCDPAAPVERTWSVPGSTESPAISLTDQAPVSVRDVGPYGRVVQQIDIRGTPATVYRGVGTAPGSWFVQWTPNTRQTITLGVSTAGRYRWNASSAVKLAREVTGYTTVSTGRLGEPTVPGTVAATYNSADGPLRNAENLLKSSRVHVGVDCIGRGPLSVTIRGASTTFACGGKLEHHEFTSTGSPSDAFTLSVDADPDVRWSLSLARATLDGS